MYPTGRFDNGMHNFHHDQTYADRRTSLPAANPNIAGFHSQTAAQHSFNQYEQSFQVERNSLLGVLVDFVTKAHQLPAGTVKSYKAASTDFWAFAKQLQMDMQSFNIEWRDLFLIGSSVVTLRDDVKIELVDKFPIQVQSQYMSKAAVDLNVAQTYAPKMNAAATPPTITQTCTQTESVTLPALSVLKKRAEEILGMSLQGNTAADDVTVYPESFPVGILVKNLKKETYTSIHLSDVCKYLLGHHKTVKERFPDFPGMKPFLLRHPHIFFVIVDEEKFEEKMKQTVGHKGRVNREDFYIVLLKNPACHHVISDEQFAKICALADYEQPTNAQVKFLSS